jgi:hypothetical protein
MSSQNTQKVLADMDFEESVHDDKQALEDEAEQLKISKEFQEMVVKYVKLDDMSRKKEKEIKELKALRKPCEDFILKYLEKIGETTIDITNGKLRRNKSETKIPLSQDIIKDAIKEKVADPKVVEEIVKLMDTMRPTNVRTNLKRTGKRTKGGKDDDDDDEDDKKSAPSKKK